MLRISLRAKKKNIIWNNYRPMAQTPLVRIVVDSIGATVRGLEGTVPLTFE